MPPTGFPLLSNNIFWLLVGEGPEKETLIKNLKNVKNLKILPLQKREDLNLLLNAADIHILPQRIGIETNALPSKFLGMLASGKPIITCASKNTFLGELASEVGIRTDPENKVQIIEAILKLEVPFISEIASLTCFQAFGRTSTGKGKE